MTKAASLLVKPYQQPDEEYGQIISSKSSSQVWDCGSSLYDSFELNSFNRQLDSAINKQASSRTLSMPHLSAEPPLPALMTITKSCRPHQLVSKKVGTISKSLKNALRSVFWSSSTTIVNNTTTISKANTTRATTHTRDSFQVYNGSNSMRVLTTIPELQEIEDAKFSMEATPVVRRSASERFSTAPAIVSVSCGPS